MSLLQLTSQQFPAPAWTRPGNCWGLSAVVKWQETQCWGMGRMRVRSIITILHVQWEASSHISMFRTGIQWITNPNHMFQFLKKHSYKPLFCVFIIQHKCFLVNWSADEWEGLIPHQLFWASCWEYILIPDTGEAGPICIEIQLASQAARSWYVSQLKLVCQRKGNLSLMFTFLHVEEGGGVAGGEDTSFYICVLNPNFPKIEIMCRLIIGQSSYLL